MKTRDDFLKDFSNYCYALIDFYFIFYSIFELIDFYNFVLDYLN